MTRRHSDSDDKGVRLGAATCVRETDKAILVEVDDFEHQAWIPKSCIHDDSEVFEAGGEGELIVQTWFAKKEDWV